MVRGINCDPSCAVYNGGVVTENETAGTWTDFLFGCFCDTGLEGEAMLSAVGLFRI